MQVTTGTYQFCKWGTILTGTKVHIRPEVQAGDAAQGRGCKSQLAGLWAGCARVQQCALLLLLRDQWVGRV
eukprot:1158239-Pelagomonas_calceolata.AAC.9